MKSKILLLAICFVVFASIGVSAAGGDVYYVSGGSPIDNKIATVAVNTVGGDVTAIKVLAHVTTSVGVQLEGNEIVWNVNVPGDYMTGIGYSVVGVGNLVAKVTGAADLLDGVTGKKILTYYCFANAAGKLPVAADFKEARYFNVTHTVDRAGKLWNRIKPDGLNVGDFSDDFVVTFSAGI